MELSKKQNEPLRLPEDFAQKMEDIKLIKSALEQLTKDFNLVCLFFSQTSFNIVLVN